MQQLIKRALVVVMCLAFLVPTAWGRSKYYRSGHPWGDDTVPQMAATTYSKTVVMTWRSWQGVAIPMFWVIKVKVPTESETAGSSKRAAKKKGVR